jgi:hypothetical protein
MDRLAPLVVVVRAEQKAIILFTFKQLWVARLITHQANLLAEWVLLVGVVGVVWVDQPLQLQMGRAQTDLEMAVAAQQDITLELAQVAPELLES